VRQQEQQARLESDEQARQQEQQARLEGDEQARQQDQLNFERWSNRLENGGGDRALLLGADGACAGDGARPTDAAAAAAAAVPFICDGPALDDARDADGGGGGAVPPPRRPPAAAARAALLGGSGGDGGGDGGGDAASMPVFASEEDLADETDETGGGGGGGGLLADRATSSAGALGALAAAADGASAAAADADADADAAALATTTTDAAAAGRGGDVRRLSRPRSCYVCKARRCMLRFRASLFWFRTRAPVVASGERRHAPTRRAKMSDDDAAWAAGVNRSVCVRARAWRPRPAREARFTLLHHFYDQLCPACAPLNWTKV